MGIWEYFSKIFVSSFRPPVVYTALFLAFIPVIREIIVRKYPQYEDIMKSYLLITIPLGLLFGLFILSLLISGYDVYNKNKSYQEQTINKLTTDLKAAREAAIPSIQQIMMQPYFANTEIPIANLAMVMSEPLIRNKTFERCNIVGPAIILLRGNIQFNGCNFHGDIESMFIETTNKLLWGIVVIENATFLDCNFDKVSFIGPKEAMDDLKKRLKESSPKNIK